MTVAIGPFAWRPAELCASGWRRANQMRKVPAPPTAATFGALR